MKSLGLISAAALSLAALSAKGDVLASWDMDGITSSGQVSRPYNFGATTLHSDVASATLSLGAGANATNIGADRYSFTISSPSGNSDDLADAKANDHYIQFDLNADSGKTLDLTSIDIFARSTDTGASDIAVLSSVDNYSSAIFTASGINDSDKNHTFNIPLTGSSYQNLSSITFRYYGWGITGTSGQTHFGHSASSSGYSGNAVGLSINGAAVPEISTTLPLAGLLSFSIIGVRNRRR